MTDNYRGVNPEWVDPHITYDEETKLYTGWDESGAYTVSSKPTRQEAIDDLIHYAVTVLGGRK